MTAHESQGLASSRLPPFARACNTQAVHNRIHQVPGNSRLITLRREALGPVPLLIERLPMVQPDYHRGLHCHDFCQLVYIESGGGAVHLSESTIEIAGGHVLLIPPGERHDLGDLDAGTDAWTLSITQELTRPGLIEPGAAWPESAHAGASHGSLPAPSQSRIGRRITTIAEELEGRHDGFEDLVRHELGALLIDVARLLPRPAPTQPALSPLTRRVLAIIDAEHTGPLSLQDIAARVRRSPAYLTTRVRKELGKPVTQLIIERRLETARQRLATTDELIDTIAERAGFADPAYFSRVFRQHHGISPLAWRKQASADTRAGKPGAMFLR